MLRVVLGVYPVEIEFKELTDLRKHQTSNPESAKL
jgi:hypothetical protein